MRLDLYIGGRKADLSESSFILLNYTRDEASNPTVVRNSFSQTITLPATDNNDAIFSNIRRPDHVTATGFNPLVRTPFQLYNERGEIIESGYVKLQTIARTENGVCSYEIALYGGLGSFFYHLSCKADGTTRTLADLYYKKTVMGVEMRVPPASVSFPMTATRVKQAWYVLKENPASVSEDDEVFRWMNFSPCYNGLPGCKFDANKCYYNGGYNDNLYRFATYDGHVWNTKNENGGILITMENEHDEWQMQDLRAYLQRPAFRLSKLMECLTFPENQGEYSFVLDASLTTGYLSPENTWLTMPMFDRDNVTPANATLADVLSLTTSVADILFGYAKLIGAVWTVDPARKVVTLMSRAAYYNNTTPVDISERMDKASSATPNGIQAKYYVFGQAVEGAFAAEYEEKYGRTYGSHWLDTGSAFNEETNEVLDSLEVIGAADVLQADAQYQVFGSRSDAEGTYTAYFFKQPFFENCSWPLYWTNSQGEEQSHTFEPSQAHLAPFLYSGLTGNYNDFLAKPQLHDEDNKALGGGGVLLFYNGFVDTPTSEQHSVIFNLTDDNAEMLSLNDNVPCWIAPNIIATNPNLVLSLPSFRRIVVEEEEGEVNIPASWEMGAPRMTATPETIPVSATLFDLRWALYLADRYDKDAVVTTRKVNLLGLVVSADMLRRFYWFDGCIWSLNKIINYSPTTPALTECEFIKVKNISNYQ